MTPNEREKLMRLLTAIISAQDDVSWLNCKTNPNPGDEQLQELIAIRNGYRNKILALFNKVSNPTK